MKRVCGIIGGMGPMATADLFVKIINHTKAAGDAEHMRVLIDSNVNVPDRTKAILHGGVSPLTELLHSANGLVLMGADFLIMPCNTAHYFYEELQAGVAVPVLNMVSETVRVVWKAGVKKAGLLATDGTLQAGIYDAAFARAGVELIKPSQEGQRAVMDVIFRGVKAGSAAFDTLSLERELQDMRSRGAETFVLACTELPIAFSRYNLDFPSVDPTDILARAAVVYGGYELKD